MNWPVIVAACAEVIQQTGQTPREWFEEHYPAFSWNTASRYLTTSAVSEEQRSQSEKQNRVHDAGSHSPASPPKQIKSKKSKRRKGAPEQNNNAVKHGFYSDAMSADDRRKYQDAEKLDNVNHELRIARMQLARVLRHRNEHESTESQPANVDDLKAMDLSHLRVTTHEVELGTDGGTEKWSRELPDYDSIIDRFLARIAQLTTLKGQLEQSPLLSKADQQAEIQITLTKLNKGELTAVEAGLQLEALMISLPATLSAMIKVELLQEAEENYEGGGVSAEEINQRALELEEEKERQRQNFLLERKQQLAELDKDMGL